MQNLKATPWDVCIEISYNCLIFLLSHFDLDGVFKSSILLCANHLDRKYGRSVTTDETDGIMWSLNKTDLISEFESNHLRSLNW